MSVSAIIFYTTMAALACAGMLYQTVNFLIFKKRVKEMTQDDYNLHIKEIIAVEISFTFTFWLFLMFVIMFWYTVSLLLPHILAGKI